MAGELLHTKSLHSSSNGARPETRSASEPAVSLLAAAAQRSTRCLEGRAAWHARLQRARHAASGASAGPAASMLACIGMAAGVGLLV
jgi:hypothetical protein